MEKNDEERRRVERGRAGLEGREVRQRLGGAWWSRVEQLGQG